MRFAGALVVAFSVARAFGLTGGTNEAFLQVQAE